MEEIPHKKSKKKRKEKKKDPEQIPLECYEGADGVLYDNPAYWECKEKNERERDAQKPTERTESESENIPPKYDILQKLLQTQIGYIPGADDVSSEIAHDAANDADDPARTATRRKRRENSQSQPSPIPFARTDGRQRRQKSLLTVAAVSMVSMV